VRRLIMKAKLETAPLEHPGVILESETPEEAQRLNDIWNGHGEIAEWSRLPGGNISLSIAPSAEKEA
jgi:hypothetical protein